MDHLICRISTFPRSATILSCMARGPWDTCEAGPEIIMFIIYGISKNAKFKFFVPTSGQVGTGSRCYPGAPDHAWRGTVWDVQCNNTQSRESFVASQQSVFLVAQPFAKSNTWNSQYIAIIAYPNPSPVTSTGSWGRRFFV